MTPPEQIPATSWYYRSGDREIGPVTSSRLRQLARQQRIAEDDLVRMGRTAEWIPAGSIGWLRAKPRPNAPDPSSSTESSQPETDQDQFTATFARNISAGFQSAARYLAGSLFLLRQITAAAALVAIVIGLFQVARNAGVFDRSEPVDALATIQEFGADVRRLRDAKAGEAQWNALAEQGRKSLPPLVTHLEREAGSHNRLAQLLLWSARDCLPLMFDDARVEPSAAERQFDEHMQNIALLQQNRPLYGGNRGGRAARANWLWSAGDPWTQMFVTGLVIADLGVVVWLVRWWRKPRGIDREQHT
jgi:hypothetical protein